MSSYNLNPTAAREASQSLRISVSGKYEGHFTRAEAIKSNSDTEGVEFSFITNDGQTADFLTLWTRNRDGKELLGMKQLSALMACMKVR